MTLKKRYENICNEYVLKFCEKQDMNFEGWVGDFIGGIAMCSDFYFDFSDIVLDINTKQSKHTIIEWHDQNVENENKIINYYSFTKGLRIKDIK